MMTGRSLALRQSTRLTVNKHLATWHNMHSSKNFIGSFFCHLKPLYIYVVEVDYQTAWYVHMNVKYKWSCDSLTPRPSHQPMF